MGGRGREPLLHPARVLRGVPYLRAAESWPHREASAPIATLLARRNDGALADSGEVAGREQGGGGERGKEKDISRELERECEGVRENSFDNSSSWRVLAIDCDYACSGFVSQLDKL